VIESLYGPLLPHLRPNTAIVLDVALVHPHKRRRWHNLAGRHRDLFQRVVRVLGPDFFYDVLMDYGDTNGPLRNAATL
jgi:hypothetical protein